jgi:hypothetical protein
MALRTGIRIDAHGGPEALRVTSLPSRPPAAGEVRVAVTHVALNHLDLWVRKGVPGHDFHLPRALWLADLHGISANAFVSRSLPWEISGKTRVREWFARVNAVIDELTEKEPAVEPPRVRLPIPNP